MQLFSRPSTSRCRRFPCLFVAAPPFRLSYCRRQGLTSVPLPFQLGTISGAQTPPRLSLDSHQVPPSPSWLVRLPESEEHLLQESVENNHGDEDEDDEENGPPPTPFQIVKKAVTLMAIGSALCGFFADPMVRLAGSVLQDALVLLFAPLIESHF